MKRPLLIIAMFLLLGAVVNVAVAWGFAAWVQFPLPPVVPDRLPYGVAWPRPVPPEWPPPTDSVDGSSFGTTVIVYSTGDITASELDYEQLLLQFGWPLRSLEWEWVREGWTYRISASSLPVPEALHPASNDRVLPLRPVWPGFAINTVLYGAVLWLLIPGPFALRRFLRVRRGLCPKCGYPMGESVVCTECGLPQRARTA